MFPLNTILNILAGGIFFIYWGIVFVILYHLSRFGIGVQPKKFAAVFLLGSVILSVAVIILFVRMDINITALLP